VQVNTERTWFKKNEQRAFSVYGITLILWNKMLSAHSVVGFVVQLEHPVFGVKKMSL
jgi:hypothetical protein